MQLLLPLIILIALEFVPANLLLLAGTWRDIGADLILGAEAASADSCSYWIFPYLGAASKG